MSRRGMTLVETLLALVVASILLAAVAATLLAGQRTARALAAARGLRQNTRAAAAVLRAELEGLAPSVGDLLAIADSAIVLRAQRLFGVTCTEALGGAVTIPDSLFRGLRQPDPAKDSVLVFREGDSLTYLDDGWAAAAITAVRGGTCPDGTPATVLSLGAPPAVLAGVARGAPVRVFEVAEYRRYRDSAGLWWLGVRNPAGAGWSATSPVAGPLQPRTGLVLRYFTAALQPTLARDSVALVEITLRLLDARPFAVGGRIPAATADSFVVQVALGQP